MMMAGIKILFCLGFALGADGAVGDPNHAGQSITRDSQAIRQQMEFQRMSAMEPNLPTRSDTLKQVVTQLQALQVSAKSAGRLEAPAAEKIKEEKKASAKPSFGQAAISSLITGGNKESGAVQAVSLNEVQKPINAMATADALYQAKDYRNAVRFYQMAAQVAGKDDPAGCQWALYQTANCLRNEDAEKAIAAYRQLIAEYPSSSWANAALIQQKNLEWFKQNQTTLSKTKPHNDPNQ
jgi:tetratricopeptide (TPR) repeat protein